MDVDGVLMNEWVSVGQLVFHIQWKERSLWARQEVLLGKEKIVLYFEK